MDCRITDRDQDELCRGRSLPQACAALAAVDQASFPLPKLKMSSPISAESSIERRGIVMVQGFPIDRLDRQASRSPIWLGSVSRREMVQNKHGHVLGHVKDWRELRHQRPKLQYQRRGFAFIPMLALRRVLCLHPAKEGGDSRVAAVTLYNKMFGTAARSRDVLTKDSIGSHNARLTPGTSPCTSSRSFASPMDTSAPSGPDRRSIRSSASRRASADAKSRRRLRFIEAGRELPST